MDSDGNGFVSEVEFRNAIRKLNLGMTSREIDQLMRKIDSNSDGKISWQEFISKFKTNDIDETIKLRGKEKMARLKEQMILHMTSPTDAYRFVRKSTFSSNPFCIQFDSSKAGKMTYQEFSQMIIKLSGMSGETQPAYAVMKDLFDTVDVRKDGIIDPNEWQQTFGNVTEGSKKLTIRATPLNMWETTREYKQIGATIAKSRK